MTSYAKHDVYRNTLNYFKDNELQTNVWIDKYCLKGKNNEYLELNPKDMHKRLAKEFARIEKKYPNSMDEESIFNLLDNFSYIIPGGSILYGVGNNHSTSSLGNCFVIGNTSDSYGGICATDQEQAQLMKNRAGVGHDLSHLRPSESSVSNAAGTSTGAVSFMHRYSNTTREVAQNGRRGALMITLDVNHPDIEQFIESKSDLSKVTGANISVKITDEFMEAVENDEDYPLHFPTSYRDKTNAFNTIRIKAKELWNKIIHQAWKTAEPGVLFWDTIKKESIPSCYGKDWQETATNPCGEIPLCPYDSCRLMSVNLYSFVENPFTDKAYFNYDKFKNVVHKAQRLMDDVIDLEEEKIDKILNKIENDPEPKDIKQPERNLWLKVKRKLLEGRRTGLSAIGLADSLAALSISYGSNESIEIIDEIYKQFATSAYESSIDMAKERGSFPIFDPNNETDNLFLMRLFPGLKYLDANNGRRNIALLTIPPSGTISLLADISSGIEPVYQLHYKRRRKLEKDNPKVTFVDQNGDGWEEYNVLHPKFKDWLSQFDDFIDINTLSSEALQNHAKNSPYHNSTAYEIDPLQRVKLQATIQKYIDHSISSTINLPEDVSEQTISDIYMTAWKQDLKGITIYRDNCRTGVLISNEEKSKDTEFKQHNAPKRPKSLNADIHSTTVKGEKFYVIIGLYNDKPYEVFAIKQDLHHFSANYGKLVKVSKGNYVIHENGNELGWKLTEILTDEEATVTRLVSTSLRHGADIKFIVEQLNKTHGDLTSFGKAIARVLKKYIEDNNEVTNKTCPECKTDNLVYQEGCVKCTNCGYTKC